MNLNTSAENKTKLLVLTSGYKRCVKDNQYDDDFVVVLTEKLAQDFDTTVIAPKDKHSRKSESINGVKIFRHPQSVSDRFNIAYGDGIVANLATNKRLFITVPFFIIFQFLLLLKIAREEKPAIILSHFLIPQGIVAFLYKILFARQIKTMTIVHGSDVNAFDNKFLNKIKGAALNSTDTVCAVSEPLKNKILSLDQNRQVYVYPMGVNTKLFNPNKSSDNLKNHLNINSDMLLFTGSCIEKKGIRYLIQAMPLIISEFPKVKLVIVGNGNLLNEMKNLSISLECSDNILFVGHVEHNLLPAYFASASIFILPSLSEGFPLVVSEALSSGVFTLVSDIPVFENFDKNNHNLLFISKKRDPDDIAKIIINILKNKKEYSTIRVASRKYAMEHLDWDIVSKKYRKLIQNTIRQ